MKRIVADPAKCLACRACETACAMAHVDTDDLIEAIAVHGASPRIYIEAAGEFAVPLQCRHCDDAPCMQVCPSGALMRHSQGGPVLADQAKCIGCQYCVQACPFGVIRINSKQAAVIKCDLCIARRGQGLEPACVEACPVGALRLAEMEADAKQARARTAAQAVAAR
ncbi:MAG: 4Fe-4S dicluster domain-containing protein [Candidatus Nealsonbacteria bacterium]|nr:4Fe-4S dicluster domain-containing protein [Candidatus Nealsonbacteria bacterium]